MFLLCMKLFKHMIQKQLDNKTKIKNCITRIKKKIKNMNTSYPYEDLRMYLNSKNYMNHNVCNPFQLTLCKYENSIMNNAAA